MWIWLDPERHPDLRRCEARRIAGARCPAPAPGDWPPLPRLARWYADEFVVPAPPQLVALPPPSRRRLI